jgi:hypothetical protein
VCRVVISQVNQCHVVATTVNSTLADRWHYICDSFTTLNLRGAKKKNERKEGVIRQIKTKKKKFFF